MFIIECYKKRNLLKIWPQVNKWAYLRLQPSKKDLLVCLFEDVESVEAPEEISIKYKKGY